MYKQPVNSALSIRNIGYKASRTKLGCIITQEHGAQTIFLKESKLYPKANSFWGWGQALSKPLRCFLASGLSRMDVTGRKGTRCFAASSESR